MVKFRPFVKVRKNFRLIEYGNVIHDFDVPYLGNQNKNIGTLKIFKFRDLKETSINFVKLNITHIFAR